MADHSSRPSIVTGLLEDFPLERLLGFLEACGATGRLALTGGFEIDAIYLDQGIIAQAHDAKGEGFEAFARALLRDPERFCFEPGVTGVQSRICESSAHLILKVLRRRPPSERLLDTYAFSGDTLVFSTEAGASHRAPVTLTPSEASILGEVEEGTTVRSVSVRVGIDMTLTSHILLRLAAAGLVAKGAMASLALAAGEAEVARLTPARRLQIGDFLRRLNPVAPLGFRISPADAQVFALVDDKRTIGDISGTLGQEVDGVRRALERLQGLGLLVTPRAQSAPVRGSE